MAGVEGLGVWDGIRPLATSTRRSLVDMVEVVVGAGVTTPEWAFDSDALDPEIDAEPRSDTNEV